MYVSHRNLQKNKHELDFHQWIYSKLKNIPLEFSKIQKKN